MVTGQKQSRKIFGTHLTQSLFKVLIFGRPNVGKSSLMNALLGYRRSIVMDQPGTTLDDVREITDWGQGPLVMWDSEGRFLDEQKEHILKSLDEADAILWVVDGQSGLTLYDKEFISWLKPLNKPFLLVINKTEDSKENTLGEFAQLKISDFMCISANHKKNIGHVKNWILARQEKWNKEHKIETGFPAKQLTNQKISIAIVGKPNAGKSTLINLLSNQDISRVSPVPLTTRDSVRFDLGYQGYCLQIIDTAGMRRPRSKKETIEVYSLSQSLQAIEQADVVVLMVSAAEGISDQDQRLFGLIERKGKACLILYNAWDALSQIKQREFVRNMPRLFERSPHMTISAKTGVNCEDILPKIVQMFEQGQKRLTTSTVNEVIRKIVAKNPPPSSGRANFNILYGSQIKASPPTFVIFLNRKDALPVSYKNYFENSLKEYLKLKGQALRVVYRSKRAGAEA